MKLSTWAPVAFFFFALPALSQNVATVKYVAAPVFLLRPGELTHVKPGDALRANDILVTGPEGRARIILLDASEVTLGPRTEMRVVIHDPEKQQTLIEMLHGRVRTKVTPVTKQGGFFKVATPTAIAYALGSELVTETEQGVLVDTSETTLTALARKNVNPEKLKQQASNNPPVPSAPSSSAPTSLSGSARLHGIVRDATGLPVTGAQITVRDSRGALQTAMTDANGGYGFNNLPAGSAAVTVSVADQPSWTRSNVYLDSARANELNLSSRNTEQEIDGQNNNDNSVGGPSLFLNDTEEFLRNLTAVPPNITPSNVGGSENALTVLSGTMPTGTIMTSNSQPSYSSARLPDPEAGITDPKLYNWLLIAQYLFWALSSDLECPPERCYGFVGGGMATVDPPTLEIDDGPPLPPVHSVVGDLTFDPGESLTIDRIADNRLPPTSNPANQIGGNFSFDSTLQLREDPVHLAGGTVGDYRGAYAIWDEQSQRTAPGLQPKSERSQITSDQDSIANSFTPSATQTQTFTFPTTDGSLTITINPVNNHPASGDPQVVPGSYYSYTRTWTDPHTNAVTGSVTRTGTLPTFPGVTGTQTALRGALYIGFSLPNPNSPIVLPEFSQGTVPNWANSFAEQTINEARVSFNRLQINFGGNSTGSESKPPATGTFNALHLFTVPGTGFDSFNLFNRTHTFDTSYNQDTALLMGGVDLLNVTDRDRAYVAGLDSLQNGYNPFNSNTTNWRIYDNVWGFSASHTATNSDYRGYWIRQFRPVTLLLPPANAVPYSGGVSPPACGTKMSTVGSASSIDSGYCFNQSNNLNFAPTPSPPPTGEYWVSLPLNPSGAPVNTLFLNSLKPSLTKTWNSYFNGVLERSQLGTFQDRPFNRFDLGFGHNRFGLDFGSFRRETYGNFFYYSRDSWTLGKRLTQDYGLRFDSYGQTSNFFGGLTTGSPTTPLVFGTNRFGPTVGFAYSPQWGGATALLSGLNEKHSRVFGSEFRNFYNNNFDQPKTVLRAGYARFADRPVNVLISRHAAGFDGSSAFTVRINLLPNEISDSPTFVIPENINLNDLVQNQVAFDPQPGLLSRFNQQHGVMGYFSTGPTMPTAPNVGRIEVMSEASAVDTTHPAAPSIIESLLYVTPNTLGPTFKQPLSVPVNGTIVVPLVHDAVVIGQEGSSPLILNTLRGGFLPSKGSPVEVGVLLNGKNVQLQPVSDKLPSPETIAEFNTIIESLKSNVDINGNFCIGELIENGVSDSPNPQAGTSFGGNASSTPLFNAHAWNISSCPATGIVTNGAVFVPSHKLGAKGKGLFGALAGAAIGAATGVTVIPVPELKDEQDGISEGLTFTIPPTSGPENSPPNVSPKGGGKEPPAAKPNEVIIPVPSYCLDLHKLAPHPQVVYKFADENKQRELGKYGEVGNRIFRAVQSREVQLPPGVSLALGKQWTYWALREGLDAKKFTEEYMHLVEKNYEAQKKKLDKDTKAKMEQNAAQLFAFVQHFLPK